MKFIFRIILLIIVVLGGMYLFANRALDNTPLTASVQPGSAVPVPEEGVGSAILQTSRPERGLSIYIGQSIERIIEEWGAPLAKQPSAYGYDWYIFKEPVEIFVGVEKDGTINQVYTAALNAEVEPFKIEQPVEEVYRFAIVEPEINVPIGDNHYTFSLNQEDLQTRMLIMYDGLFVQLYLDQEKQEIIGVRFINPLTLVKHQPYEMTYMGEWLQPKRPSSSLQAVVDQTMENQLIDLTNQFRVKEKLPVYTMNAVISEFAKEQSKEAALQRMKFDGETSLKPVSSRLEAAGLAHVKAAENQALNYLDSIEAFHGWWNSKPHRELILSNQFTVMGVGVYDLHYTEIYIELTKEQQQLEELYRQYE